MTEADRYVDREISDKLILSVRASVGLLFLTFVLWATLSPAWALPLTLLATLFVNTAIATFLALSNMVLHSRAQAFQDSVSTMVHTNLLRELPAEDRNSGALVDRSIEVTDRLTRVGLEKLSATSVDDGEDGRDSPWAMLTTFAWQVGLLGLAAFSGLYFSTDFENMLTSVVDAVHSMR